MKNNVFQKETVAKIAERIEKLSPATKAVWGTMSVDQMLAHCNVTYEMVYENTHAKPNFFMRFILKNLVKQKVVSDKPFVQNGRTAPQFVIENARDFDKEKTRLLAYIHKTQELGETHFDGKESLSFGKLKVAEWNNLFYKHLDHHLRQFGV